MRKCICIIVALLCALQLFIFPTIAKEYNEAIREVGVGEIDQIIDPSDDVQASGLILDCSLSISRYGNTTLRIDATIVCKSTVVKCGFKSLKVERRANSSSSWSEYYNYGNQYNNASSFYFCENLTVDSNYQYRVTCKHYAKVNFLNTQTMSNTSNIVTF